MDKPRKIVVILGNGFDLDLGLKTSYKDFWESKFCPKDYPAPIIHHLNQRWNDDLDAVKWYDLENELLKYYVAQRENRIPKDVIDAKELEYIKRIKPYQIAYGVLQEEYGDQIQSLLQKGIIVKAPLGYDIPYQSDLLKAPVERDKIALEKIKTGLCNYLKSLQSNSEPTRYCVPFQVFKVIMDKISNTDIINVYSFNYTRIPWGFSSQYQDIIHYVHGNCDKGSVIIGTRDEDMTKEYCFLQKPFDGQFSPPPIVEDLSMADEVIIFGHSLGINDRQYFKSFFTAQSGFGVSKPKDITIITKDASSVIEVKRSLQQLTDNQLSVLMSKNRVRFVLTDLLKEKDESLYNFFISHGENDTHSSEIVGKIKEQKKKEENANSQREQDLRM